MIPFEEVNVLDRNSEHLGFPTAKLMENAGRGIAEALKQNFDIRGKKVLFVCGSGNNGGDAFVAARLLADLCQTTVLLARPPEDIRSEISKMSFERYTGKVIIGADSAPGQVESADVIVDALLGIGVRGDVREPLKTLVGVINGSGKPIVSVDVPSGFGSKTAVRPTITVTLHDVKIGMNKENSGKIVKVDIGIPHDAERFTGPGELVYFPRPAKESHKGDNGVLLVVSGGPFTGAPALVGLAALRAGCDLVRVATPERIWQVVASFSPALIVRPLAGDFLSPRNVEDLLEMAKEADAAVVGPGLGREDATLEAVREFVSKIEIPFVVDADGITAVAQDLSSIKGKECIVTPHSAELKRLCGKEPPEDREEKSRFIDSFSKENDLTVLFKGPVDVIAGEGRLKLNRTGNAAMTVGGTGDVLAGICGSLLSRGVKPFNAARMGAFICGHAGDLAFEKLSYGLTPMDVVSEIPEVLRTLLKK